MLFKAHFLYVRSKKKEEQFSIVPSSSSLYSAVYRVTILPNGDVL